MVCLPLALGASPRRVSAAVERACERQRALAAGWAAQARCGALTRALPSPLARLILNVVSRRYALSYAEINAPVNAPSRRTLWGHEVDAVVYWRPPQANISMYPKVKHTAFNLVNIISTNVLKIATNYIFSCQVCH